VRIEALRVLSQSVACRSWGTAAPAVSTAAPATRT